jgi:hypothetical protein
VRLETSKPLTVRELQAECDKHATDPDFFGSDADPVDEPEETFDTGDFNE